MPASAPGGPTSASPQRWLLLAALPFAAYFVLLLTCDLRRPVAWGALLSSGREGVVVLAVQPGSPADHAGLAAGDRLLRADSRDLRTRVDWTAFEMTLDLDRPLAIEYRRDGSARTTMVTLPLERLNFWRTREGVTLAIARAVQALTLLAALVVIRYRADDATGRLAAWLLAAVAVFTVAPPYRLATVWTSLPLPVAIALWGPYLSALGVSAILCSFFAVFPYRFVRRPIVWAVVWTPMALALTVHVRFVVDLLDHPEQTHEVTRGVEAILPLTAAYILVGLVLLVVGYHRLDSDLDRRRTRVVVFGSLLALLVGMPIAVGFWLNPNVQLSSSLFSSPAVTVGTLCLLIFPLTFTYAMVRHRLLGVPMILRQGLQHALARRALLSFVPLVGALLVLDVLVHGDQPLSTILQSRGWLYLAVFVGVAVARVRRRAWLDALDRQFFRQRYDGRLVLQEVAADVRHAGSFEAAAVQVAERVAVALQPSVTAVLLRRDGDSACRPVAVVPADLPVADLDEDSRILGLTRALAGPLDLAPSEPRSVAPRLPDRDRTWLARSGIELVVPIVVGPGRADALLVLGARLSEESYSAEDLELLAAVADSLALVLGATGDSERIGAMSECPSCGRCYGPAERRCAVDGVGLVSGRVPRRLGDRYLIEQRLARGGMGTVYEAVDTHLGRQVAVKVLREELAGSADAIERFGREARLLASLNHPNIVIVHDAGVLLGSAYLVMERLEGRTLRELLQVQHTTGPGETVLILRAVASALDAAHAGGIVHRDLKPDNVFLAQIGSVRVPKVLDFGLARLAVVTDAPPQFVTRALELWGTPAYMAPEQTPGEAPSSAWDRYALAVMAYEMVTGRVPDEPLSSGLAGPVRAFFDVALAADPARRPTTGRALVDQLEDAIGRAEAGAA
jgi:hypothetical protein